MSAAAWHRLAVVLAITALSCSVAFAAQQIGQALAQDPTLAVPDACLQFKAPGDSGIFVNLPNDTTPESIDHVRDAVAAGGARLLHWNPAKAAANRAASLRAVPLWSRLPAEQRQRYNVDTGRFDGPSGSYGDWALPHQRDEYPPAASDEGGAGADVRYILSADNSRSGQRLGAVMSPYCAETTFIEEP